MKRVISPKLEEISKLRQQLEKSEMQILHFFNEYLPIEWEIYIQPHLNGLRPDFVLLNPKVGIAVFEIKNWNFESINLKTDYKNTKPILIGKNNNRSFIIKENPIEKILTYKNEIQNLYCPRLNAQFGYGVITAGLIFPSAPEERIREIFTPFLIERGIKKNWANYYPISGKESLENNNIQRIFPEMKRLNSLYMNEELAKDLRLWLVEPNAPIEQRNPVKLTAKQQKIVYERPKSGFRRIKGPAGSGKSVALATRAAKLLQENKKVLIMSYNITLLNYLQDYAVKTYSKSRTEGTWLNFHLWCKRIFEESYNKDTYRLIWKNNFQNKKLNLQEEIDYDYSVFIDKDNKDIVDLATEDICNAIIDIFNSEESKLITKYDAIIIDEGQDFLNKWLTVIQKSLNQNGDLLYSADMTQDIYGTSMKGQGLNFKGNYLTLKGSHRIPHAMIKHVQQFGRSFLPAETRDLPINSLQLGLPHMDKSIIRWVQTYKNDIANTSIGEILALFKNDEDNLISASDLTIIVDNSETGREIINFLHNKNIKCIDTFNKNKKESRKQKLSFFIGDARIKATTIHSFKGWESRCLLITIENSPDAKSFSLIYTAITRIKWSENGSIIIVVCCENKLYDYGRTWPEFIDMRGKNIISEYNIQHQESNINSKTLDEKKIPEWHFYAPID
jgi:aspartate 1-decarboxylase